MLQCRAGKYFEFSLGCGMSKKAIISCLAGVVLTMASFYLSELYGGMRRGGPRGRGRAAATQTLPKSAAEKNILAVIDEMNRDPAQQYLNVPYADGQYLRLLTETAGAKRVVEIGTSTGYSGMWFLMALSSTGGKLITYEINEDRVKMARDNFKKAGVSDMVTVVQGDAHEMIKQIKEPIDVLFLDADKDGYVDYLNKLLPQVREGGLVLAHNISSRGEIADYYRAVTTNPDLETVFFEQGSGLGISIKKHSSVPPGPK
jgi:caffeoyl-CoA O-methyltransferase